MSQLPAATGQYPNKTFQRLLLLPCTQPHKRGHFGTGSALKPFHLREALAGRTQLICATSRGRTQYFFSRSHDLWSYIRACFVLSRITPGRVVLLFSSCHFHWRTEKLENNIVLSSVSAISLFFTALQTLLVSKQCCLQTSVSCSQIFHSVHSCETPNIARSFQPNYLNSLSLSTQRKWMKATPTTVPQGRSVIYNICDDKIPETACFPKDNSTRKNNKFCM